MPDRRKHRSAAPEDATALAPEALGDLRSAVEHCSWLLSRGYTRTASLQLVGNRFELTARQREAVGRSACSDELLRVLAEREVEVVDLRGETVLVDAYNMLTTVEVALGGGAVLLARDGCARDLASLHGTWRRVEETSAAIAAVGTLLSDLGPAGCTWIVDRPVSNSGRLAGFLREAAERSGWPWTVHVEARADRLLIESPGVVASADREVLRAARRWTNLARAVVETQVPAAWWVDLS